MHISLEQLEAQLLEEHLKLLFEKAYEQGVKDAQQKYALPPLLTRRQFMELVGISGTKCAELFNRADFPVNREFGHPRVPTEQLFEWIKANDGRIK